MVREKMEERRRTIVAGVSLSEGVKQRERWRDMERQRDQLRGCGGVRPETVSAERNMARKRAEKERRWCYGEREGDEGRREGGEK
jgi:hypothetical protein